MPRALTALAVALSACTNAGGPLAVLDDAHGDQNLFLSALHGTGGGDPRALFDLDAARGWSPVGDGVDDAVSLSFQDPVAVDTLQIRACGPGQRALVRAYLNDAEGPEITLTGDTIARVALDDPLARELRTLQIRVLAATGEVCLGEVTLFEAGAALSLRPPRAAQGRIRVVGASDAQIDAERLADDDVSTGWQPATPDEALRITLDEPIDLAGVEILALPGAPAGGTLHARTDDDTIRPLVGSGPRYELRISGAQVVTLHGSPPPSVGELRLLDAHGPLLIVGPSTRPRAAPDASAAWAPLLDRSAASLCGFPKRKYKLRADHTVTVWLPEAAWSDGAHPAVLDAQWREVAGADGWSAVSIEGTERGLGRRWDPSIAQERAVRGVYEFRTVESLGPDGLKAVLRDWVRDHRRAVDCLTEELGAWDDAWTGLVERDAMLVRGHEFADLLVR